MFWRKRSLIDDEIDRAVHEMKNHQVDSKEYQAILGNVTKLYEMKGKETSFFVSKDTLATIAGNLLGILMIIVYESENVIKSKALGFVIKARV